MLDDALRALSRTSRRQNRLRRRAASRRRSPRAKEHRNRVKHALMTKSGSTTRCRSTSRRRVTMRSRADALSIADGTGKPTLADEIAALSGSDKIDEELEAMKRQLGMGGSDEKKEG